MLCMRVAWDLQFAARLVRAQEDQITKAGTHKGRWV